MKMVVAIVRPEKVNTVLPSGFDASSVEITFRGKATAIVASSE